MNKHTPSRREMLVWRVRFGLFRWLLKAALLALPASDYKRDLEQCISAVGLRVMVMRQQQHPRTRPT